MKFGCAAFKIGGRPFNASVPGGLLSYSADMLMISHKLNYYYAFIYFRVMYTPSHGAVLELKLIWPGIPGL